MTIRLFAGLLAALWISTPAAATPAGASPEQSVDDYMYAAADQLGAPGAAWAVIRDGQLEHTGTTGNDGAGDAVDEQTPFLFGSVSKPLLATLVMSLADAEALDIDEPVVEALPELGVVPDAEAITGRQLLEHTSGLPFGADHLDLVDADRTPVKVVADLGDIELVAAPGERYEYSSLGYLVLTAWVEQATGQGLADLYAEHLPLPGLDVDDISVPAGKRGPWLPAMAPPIDPAGAGYGYAAGSVLTLAALAEAALNDPARLTAMTDVEPHQDETAQGIGWRVTLDDDGTRRVWHTGTVPGYFTAIHLVPDEDLAVIVLLNRSGYLDEDRLYATSAGLLAAARGDDAALPGSGWMAYLIVGVIAAIGVAAALLIRRPGWTRFVGSALGVALLAGPALLAWVLGVPLRYGWLWLPEIVVALLVVGAAALVAGYLTRSRPQPA